MRPIHKFLRHGVLLAALTATGVFAQGSDPNAQGGAATGSGSSAAGSSATGSGATGSGMSGSGSTGSAATGGGGNGGTGNYDYNSTGAGRDHNFGWMGLLGLAGLAGLMRRNRSDVQTSDRVNNPRA